MTVFSSLLVFAVLVGLAAAVLRRSLPRAVLGWLGAGLAAAGAALAAGAPAAAVGLLALGLAGSLILGLGYFRSGELDDDERPFDRPGLVVAAFVLVPWGVLVGGVFVHEARLADSDPAATRGSLIMILMLAVALTAVVALTARGERADA